MRERRIDVAGAKLWTGSDSDPGCGPPLMLCPGGPGCCDYLGPMAGMVGDIAEAWRFEQRGCGRSDPDPPYDVETAVSDLEAVRIGLGFDHWAIGGHSWGANLALAWTLAHPDRARAVVYVAGNGLQNDRSWSAAYHQALEERGERQPDYRTPPNMDVNEVGNRSWRRFIQQSDLWRRIAELDVPVLVVMAENDIRPDWPARQLAATLPNARFEVIEEAEHWIWSSPGPAAALRDVLRDFLSTLS